MQQSGREARAERRWRALGVIAVLMLLVVVARGYSESTKQRYSLRALQAPPINVNHASFSELCDLPGVDAALARRIVDERGTHGPFADGDDLCDRVRGMGQKKLAAILAYAYIESD